MVRFACGVVWDEAKVTKKKVTNKKVTKKKVTKKKATKKLAVAPHSPGPAAKQTRPRKGHRVLIVADTGKTGLKRRRGGKPHEGVVFWVGISRFTGQARYGVEVDKSGPVWLDAKGLEIIS